MSENLGNPPWFGNPGEPGPEVDPEDLKTIWQQARDLQARHPGQNVATGVELKVICKPGVDVRAAGYRYSMIWVLTQFAKGQLAPWVKDEQVADAVLRTMATIPMEWLGPVERKGLPFDVEEFFRRLWEGGVQNA